MNVRALIYQPIASRLDKHIGKFKKFNFTSIKGSIIIWMSYLLILSFSTT